jgi:hypothetical protein
MIRLSEPVLDPVNWTSVCSTFVSGGWSNARLKAGSRAAVRSRADTSQAKDTV